MEQRVLVKEGKCPYLVDRCEFGRQGCENDVRASRFELVYNDKEEVRHKKEARCLEGIMYRPAG